MKLYPYKTRSPSSQPRLLQQPDKLFDCHLRLDNDGFERLWRQVPLTARNNNVKMSLGRMPEIGMASRLMMDIKAGANENL